MTKPGDIERIATKVVPYYVVGVVDEQQQPSADPSETNGDAESAEDVTGAAAVARRRPTWLGYLAAGLGLATFVLFIVAMIVAIGGDFLAGTALAYSTIAVSIIAIVCATICLIFGYQRRWAAFGLCLAILANPIVLVSVFRLFGGK
ncbi:MAG: 1,4-dihydroxy-6-naphthoate synthase [Rhodoglobus sp.]